MIYRTLQLAMIIKLASYVANSNSILTRGSVVVTSLFFSLQCYVLETCAETLTAQLAVQHSQTTLYSKTTTMHVHILPRPSTHNIQE